MAIFKLSAFVTAIVGSVGGTNFKRGANNAIITNKSFGGSKTKNLQNPWLNQISTIWKSWSALSQLLRDDWNQITMNYTFPDKFGVLRNLTGRQLFTKLSIQLLPINRTVPEPDQVNNILSTIVIDAFDLTIQPFHAELQLNITGGLTFVLVQIEVSKKTLLNPIFSRRKLTAFNYSEGATGFDITAAILKQYPYINNSYKVRAFVTCMNLSGFKTVPVYKNGTWIV